MAAPLEYDFRVIGRAVVEREVAALEKRFIASAARLNREFNKLANGGSGSNQHGGSSSGSSRFALPGQREYIAQQRLNHRQSLREAKEQERAAVHAVRAERQQVDNLNKSRQSIHNQRLREEKQTRVESGRTDAQKQRAIDRQSSSQQSLARQRLREEAALKQTVGARVDFIKSTVGSGVGRVAGAIGSVGRAGLAVAGISAAGLAASSISQAMTLDDLSRRISVDSRQPGTSGVDPGMLSKGFIRSSIKSGISAEDIGRGVQTYVAKTGDVDTALKYQDTMALIAQGRSTDINDVFNMSATMNQAMGVTSTDDMKKAYAILSEQGKRGRFELKDFGTEGPEILNAAGAAGMRGVSGIRDIGTLAQIGILGNNTKSETSTSIRSLFNAMYKHQDKVQSGAYTGGKKVQLYEDWDPKKKMLDVSEWLPNLISATGGNMGGLEKSMDARAFKTALPLANAYKEASLKAGGGKAGDIAGRDAMAGIWNKFHDVNDDFGNVEADARDVMKSFSVQMEILNTRLKDVVASQIFPKLVSMLENADIEGFVKAIGDITGALITLASFLKDNPFTGLMTIVSAAILAEVAKAALAAGLTKLLTGAVTGVLKSGGGPTLPGIPGMGLPIATSTGGKVLQGAAKAAAGALAGYTAGQLLGNTLGDASWGDTAGTWGAGSGAGLMLGGPLGALAGFGVTAAADQAKKLHDENGGWDFWNNDKRLNSAAKERAIAEGRMPGADGKLTVSQPTDSGSSVIGALGGAAADLKDAAGAIKDSAAAINSIGPNRSDKPTTIKTP